jgi:hypothetical protein
MEGASLLSHVFTLGFSRATSISGNDVAASGIVGGSGMANASAPGIGNAGMPCGGSDPGEPTTDKPVSAMSPSGAVGGLAAAIFGNGIRLPLASASIFVFPSAISADGTGGVIGRLGKLAAGWFSAPGADGTGACGTLGKLMDGNADKLPEFVAGAPGSGGNAGKEREGDCAKALRHNPPTKSDTKPSFLS